MKLVTLKERRKHPRNLPPALSPVVIALIAIANVALMFFAIAAALILGHVFGLLPGM